MIINSGNIRSLGVGFKANFQVGFAGVTPEYKRVATFVPSTTAEEDYGWMADLPGFREWIGPRVVHNLSTHSYTVKNKPFELTVSVKRSKIEDDNIGIYAPIMQEMGRSAAVFPDEHVFGLLAAGWDALCWDGKPYFSTQHAYVDQDGKKKTYANTDGGTGAPWFLIDTTRVLLPVIYQERKPYAFVSKTAVNDDNVFFHDEFVYGSDGRSNVGFGLPQLCWGSRQPLNAENYAKARAALTDMRGDKGRRLGLKGTLLLVGGSNESAGRKLINNDYATGGESNEWKGTAELLVNSYIPGPGV